MNAKNLNIMSYREEVTDCRGMLDERVSCLEKMAERLYEAIIYTNCPGTSQQRVLCVEEAVKNLKTIAYDQEH